MNKANLESAILVGINFTFADLTKANLSGASLVDANFLGADLEEAHLAGADLSGAYLSQVTLMGADLSGAKLIGTEMEGADSTHIALLAVPHCPRYSDLTSARRHRSSSLSPREKRIQQSVHIAIRS